MNRSFLQIQSFATGSRPQRAFRERAAVSLLQHKCACGGSAEVDGECEECREKRLQRKANGNGAAHYAPAIVHDVLRSSGRPLDVQTRAHFEPHFGHDFGRVRVHNDSRAAQSASAVNALAYTIGPNIVFGQSKFEPATKAGQALIAHELAHVVQQGQVGAGDQRLAIDVDRQSPAEAEADRIERQVSSNRIANAGPVPRDVKLQRKLDVRNPKDLIPNPTGKGVAQTNGATAEGYLQSICPGGSVTVDAGSGNVNLSSGYCIPVSLPPGVSGPASPAPAERSKEHASCGCLCDMIGSARPWTIVIDDINWPNTSGQ
jgi:hypothetical protein